MAKNFKDLYLTELHNEEISHNKERVSSVSDIESPPSKIEVVDQAKAKFSHMHTLSEIKQMLFDENKEELLEEIRKELTHTLRESVEADLKKDLYEEISKSIHDSILTETINKLDETNRSIAKSINQLASKIQQLNDNLNIQIPTPIVNVVTPKSKKKVVYDKNGRIESVEDIED